MVSISDRGVGAYAKIPVIVLDDDSFDDDVQITEVRSVRDRRYLGGTGPPPARNDEEVVEVEGGQQQSSAKRKQPAEDKENLSISACKKRRVSSQQVEAWSISGSGADNHDDGDEADGSAFDEPTRKETKETTPDKREKSPYTTKFFIDMADTVAKLFPYDKFSLEHNCLVNEVSRAISAVVVSPLMDPCLHSLYEKHRQLSVAEYGRNMIAIWEDRYRSMIKSQSTDIGAGRKREVTIPGVAIPEAAKAEPQHESARDHMSADGPYCYRRNNNGETSKCFTTSRTAEASSSSEKGKLTNLKADHLPKPSELDDRVTTPSVPYIQQSSTSQQCSPRRTLSAETPTKLTISTVRHWLEKDCFGNYVQIDPPETGHPLTLEVKTPRKRRPGLDTTFRIGPAEIIVRGELPLDGDTAGKELRNKESDTTASDREAIVPALTQNESFLAEFMTTDLELENLSPQLSEGGIDVDLSVIHEGDEEATVPGEIFLLDT